MKIFSFSPFGYEGSLVTVEVDLRRGIPAVDVVGLADGAVRESRERMRSAIRNSGFEFPLERVLISLSPADLKKEGAGFDLALALAVLDAQKNNGDAAIRDDCVLVMGELELSGMLRPVRGVHAAACTALSCGIDRCIVSSANGLEALEAEGMKVFSAENLSEAFEALYKPELFKSGIESEKDPGVPGGECTGGVMFAKTDDSCDMKHVCGQKKLVRALQIAAAGGHNLLAYGPPGCGKTLALSRFAGLLPLLSPEESQSVTRIHSLAGLLQPSQPLITVPPFRMPHQTASIEGMCGGGINCRPGEISLAHNGVLFLDEAAEFRSSVLQMLRVPLENGSISLSRAGRTTVYPAAFQLLMAANPCPCGNYGVPDKICLCSAHSVEMYWRKFSGPLLDRVDIRVNASKKDNDGAFLSTLELRKEIACAVTAQRKRGVKNSRLSPEQISRYCKLEKAEAELLEKEAVEHGFSQRGISACLKLSRTLADMSGHEKITAGDIKEAVFYRAGGNVFEDAEYA